MGLTTDFELLTTLAEIEDPRRVKSTVHNLADILFTALCGAIAGCDTWPEIVQFAKHRLSWLRQFVPLEGGVPTDDTFRRVFTALDTGRFTGGLMAWTQGLQKATKGRVLAIDGKTLRNSFDDATGKKSLHLVSAWSANNHLILGQVATEEKSNEITAIPKLLELLDLNGAVVTIDAMGCQQEIAEKIIEFGGDYILALKDNQPTMHRRTIDIFTAATTSKQPPAGLRRWVKKERRRGRDEIREHMVLPVPKDFPADKSWGIKSLGVVVRRRLGPNGEEEGQVRYYISTLSPLVRTFANAVRSHWSIENHLHWNLDVNFSEDANRTHKGAGPETTGLLRRLAVSMHMQETQFKGSLRVKRKAAGWSTDVLESILFGNPQ